ncbi:MAG TPA: hypothetical protein VMS98_10325 [Thermoanaerobaculia bacterium]|nr:hypothetical protein [Thermoanaerobaculia bacterium]
MNRDFVEILAALSAAGAEFLVVGAHALAAHKRPRATGDLDIWVRPTSENAKRVWNALVEFGAPLHDLTVEDLATADVVFQMGLPPYRVDILTSISGVTFDEAWPNRIVNEFQGQPYGVIGLRDLIRNKRAAGRPQDVVDADDLEGR